MRCIYSEISKEQYDKYQLEDPKIWKKEIRDKIPVSWECGYGYYGSDLIIKDGKYYIVHTIGNSCD